MNHHAFVIEAGAEEGVAAALAWVEKELGVQPEGNPDVVVLEHGLLSVEEARRVTELAAGAPFAGEHKVVIIAASRAYHEAQNALLKVFEEPPHGVYLFLVLPSIGGLLPTLRSRVQILKHEARSTKSQTVRNVGHNMSDIPDVVEAFVKATREKRSALIKKLTSGKDEDARRDNRDEAIALLNGIEALAYAKSKLSGETPKLLSEIAVLRGHLHDRSAPVKMILEHLAIVTPRGLV